MSYRVLIYLEFNPRDYETYAYTDGIAPYIIERKFGDWRDLVSWLLSRGPIFSLFGGGKLLDSQIEKLPNNAELWYCKGWYQFNSLDFTEDQQKNQLNFGPGPNMNITWKDMWYEKI